MAHLHSRPRLRRAVLFATAAMLCVSALAVPPAVGDVTSVDSSAFGVSITPAGTGFSVDPQPSVAFSNSSGTGGTNDASQSDVSAPPTGNPPGSFYRARSLFVRTGQIGTLGTHTAGTTSRAYIESSAYLSDVFLADQVRSECTATGDGSSGTTSFDSVSFVDSSGTPRNLTNYQPPPNTKFTLYGGVGNVTFNEQTSLNNGQTTGIIVTAIHIQYGPIDIYVGQSRCTATGPDVIVSPPPGCDMSIVKAMSPDPLVIGQAATVTLTITNVGTVPCAQPGTGGQTVVTDPKPPGLTFTSAPTAVPATGWTCALVAGDAKCATPASLAVGYTATFTINATVTALSGDSVYNCARVANPNDANAVNNEACVAREPVDPPPPPTCDLTVEKHMTPVPLVAGASASIELTVTNLGTGPCQGATLQDDKVPGLTLKAPNTQPFKWFCGIVTATGAALCQNFTVIPGGYTAKITLPATVASTATYIKNCATISSPSDTDTVNNSSCDEGAVSSALPFCDLTVDKQMGPVPLVSGQAATITLTVTNIGTGACNATTTTLRDNKVAGLTFTSAPAAPGGWVCSLPTGNASCTGPGIIPVGAAFVFTMPAQVTGAPGVLIKNCATVTNASDARTGNNTGCAQSTPVNASLTCDLQVTKNMTPQPLISGGAATIAITVTNLGNGSCPADSVNKTVVQDQQPAGMTFTSAPTAAGWVCSLSGGTVTCSRSTAIASLAQSTLTFKAKVTAAAGDVVRNCATATNANDTALANNTGCKQLPVGSGQPPPFCDLQVTKTMTPNPLKANRPATIVITVTNIGTGPCGATTAAPTRLGDGPITGMVFSAPAAKQGDWFCGLDNAVTAGCFNPTNIAKGQTASIILGATVTGAVGTTITNCVTISNPNDTNSSNNTFCLPARLVT